MNLLCVWRRRHGGVDRYPVLRECRGKRKHREDQKMSNVRHASSVEVRFASVNDSLRNVLTECWSLRYHRNRRRLVRLAKRLPSLGLSGSNEFAAIDRRHDAERRQAGPDRGRGMGVQGSLRCSTRDSELLAMQVRLVAVSRKLLDEMATFSLSFFELCAIIRFAIGIYADRCPSALLEIRSHTV